MPVAKLVPVWSSAVILTRHFSYFFQRLDFYRKNKSYCGSAFEKNEHLSASNKIIWKCKKPWNINSSNWCAYLTYFAENPSSSWKKGNTESSIKTKDENHVELTCERRASVETAGSIASLQTQRPALTRVRSSNQKHQILQSTPSTSEGVCSTSAQWNPDPSQQTSGFTRISGHNIHAPVSSVQPCLSNVLRNPPLLLSTGSPEMWIQSGSRPFFRISRVLHAARLKSLFFYLSRAVHIPRRTHYVSSQWIMLFNSTWNSDKSLFTGSVPSVHPNHHDQLRRVILCRRTGVLFGQLSFARILCLFTETRLQFS